MNRYRLLVFGAMGGAFTALCCFTPILGGLLGLVGLGAGTGYLDYALLPALAGFLGLALYGLWRRNRESVSGCCAGISNTNEVNQNERKTYDRRKDKNEVGGRQPF